MLLITTTKKTHYSQSSKRSTTHNVSCNAPFKRLFHTNIRIALSRRKNDDQFMINIIEKLKKSMSFMEIRIKTHLAKAS
jgi:hypothetical protein